MPKFPVHEKTEVRETEHFRIIYQKPLAEAVPLIAEYCEESYGILTRVFDWKPLEKTTVLIQDGFDTHNGWATPISHNTISIYIAGPAPGTSIFQDGNYIRRTVFHEMTHVISTDIRIGYSRILSSVFGKVAPTDTVSMGLFLFTSSPVMLAPRWFLEGVSIWSETEFCPPGRGRSTYADMVFRCAVRDDNLLPYSSWYVETPTWPYGEGAYLYGMKFFQYLYESGSTENSVGEETQNLAGSFLFNLDSATQKTTGKTAWEMAEEMLAHETLDQKEKLDHLNSFILTENKRLTPPDISAYHPVFAGERIFFLGMEPENRESLYAYDLKKQETEKIAGTRSNSVFGSMTASGDGRYVYYTVLEVQQNENVYAEIRKFDTKENTDTLVTDSGRYVAIDISPDGKKIVAVSQRSGRSHLLLLDLDKEGDVTGEKILSVKPLFTILSTPRFSPDGSQIAFAETREDGYCLKVFHLAKAVEKNIYQSKKQILTPGWHPLKNLLVFSSDMNGVYNLFSIKAEENSQPVALTHVVGGLFSPVVSKQAKNIAAIGYDSKGPYLTLIPYPVISMDISVLPNRSFMAEWKNKTFFNGIDE
jgi:WD40 repeat protein